MHIIRNREPVADVVVEQPTAQPNTDDVKTTRIKIPLDVSHEFLERMRRKDKSDETEWQE